MQMRWVALKLDAGGGVIADIPIPVGDRATEMAYTLEQLDETATTLVVGVSLGSPTQPFDPDDGAWEPHGWRFGALGE